MNLSTPYAIGNRQSQNILANVVGLGRIFCRGGNSAFFQVYSMRIFPREQQRRISIYKLKNKRKTLFLQKNSTEKHQIIFKIHGRKDTIATPFRHPLRIKVFY